MSSWVMSKLDIDVLVQLAMYGPVGARSWRRLTDDPHRLGRDLWQQNADAAGHEDDEPPPVAEYRFEPLPIGITAEEGLKQCACYGYQTFDEGPEEPAGPFLELLEVRLRDSLGGYDAAPWGWSRADVEDRLERGGGPGMPADPPVADVAGAGIPRASGTVLATGVPTHVDLGLRTPWRREWVAVGHDDPSRRRLADLIVDDGVRAAVLDVDLSRGSVLAVIGTAPSFDTAVEVAVLDRVALIMTERLPPPAATVVVTDTPIASAAGAARFQLVERATGHRRAVHPDPRVF